MSINIMAVPRLVASKTARLIRHFVRGVSFFVFLPARPVKETRIAPGHPVPGGPCIKKNCAQKRKEKTMFPMQDMHTALLCLFFGLGIALIVKGGDMFVDAASWIAKAMRVPTFVIGATIVSVATTLPEMIVSIVATAEGSTELAIGNAVGSVTANTALIMAIAMLAMTIFCERKKYLPQCILLVAAASTLLLSCLSGTLHIAGALVLAAIFVTFMVMNVRSARAQSTSGDEPREPICRGILARNICFFAVGAAAIYFGSRFLVDSGSEIATRLGVDERVIAITFVAIGTSLPELVTTVTAIIKKESSLSVGNIIGANIIDLSLILPICSAVCGGTLTVSRGSLLFDLPACLIATLIAAVPLMVRQKASKVQGAVLLCAYATYLVLSVFVF